MTSGCIFDDVKKSRGSDRHRNDLDEHRIEADLTSRRREQLRPTGVGFNSSPRGVLAHSSSTHVWDNSDSRVGIRTIVGRGRAGVCDVSGGMGISGVECCFPVAAAYSAFFRRRGQATLNCSALSKWVWIGARIRDNDARW